VQDQRSAGPGVCACQGGADAAGGAGYKDAAGHGGVDPDLSRFGQCGRNIYKNVENNEFITN
jgi:hypothetical protein